MKNFSTGLLLALLLICGLADGKHIGVAEAKNLPDVYAQQGYIGPGPSIITVTEAKKLRDDTPVTLRGKIERFLGDEKYLFSDNTGNIIIEIDDDIWRWGNLTIDEKDMVEITGEIDRSFRKVEIDVKAIRKLN